MSADTRGKVLIVDDNEDVLFALNALLYPYVEKIKVTTTPEKIGKYIEEFQPDVILLDMNFQRDTVSGKEGFFWLDRILKIDPQAVVILMTAYADTEKAVQAIKAGATDFISKPWENEKLLATVFSGLKLKESKKEVSNLKNQMEALNVSAPEMNEIIGESEAMQEVFSLVEKLSETDANILILGENGTGKDIFARAIYHNSPRSKDVFVSIDLGSISESLFESELFGYEKGAFTDAKKEKKGRMEIASGGTLFLDEIGNLSLPMQAKMLTAIEKKTISRLGSTKNIPIDVRFICATNADIYQAVEEGGFRQDLLYRINTIEIHIPPLRDRGNDIVLLAEYFVHKYAHKYKKDIQKLSLEVKRKLCAYNWPGNVRELQNTIERAVILSSGKVLKTEDFILNSKENKKSRTAENLNLEQLEKETIEKALTLCNGNLNKAADILGISRFALYRKINKK
ncbi:MAG: sigma-54 dependent transcriptional regulator [Prevotella sp.]|jgi:DNA-binding NtrC family response regulator|nr:sigma-54 dependent transcriptional regulator [Prevotella sp.]